MIFIRNSLVQYQKFVKSKEKSNLLGLRFLWHYHGIFRFFIYVRMAII
ncbi:hypothetical protein pb186bvf_003693 [Paramecium bursaria]